MTNIVRQGGFFIFVSGIGWLMDFGIYTCLSSFWGVPVAYANMLGSVPAVTFVFIFSTRRIFSSQRSRLGLRIKYAIYLGYQFALITLVSTLAGYLYFSLSMVQVEWGFFYKYLNIIVKCLITPITMICNFLVMKFLIEKI